MSMSPLRRMSSDRDLTRWADHRPHTNDDLVVELIQTGAVVGKELAEAFFLADRGVFLPNYDRLSAEDQNAVYMTRPLNGPNNIRQSNPKIYAMVLRELGLSEERGVSFLNIGSGTGYLSVLAGLLLGNAGLNHGIEIHENLVEFSRARTAQFRERLRTQHEAVRPEFCAPVFVQGNVLHLDPAERKYDRIYCSAAIPVNRVDDMLPHLVSLLSPGGILVVPLGNRLERISVPEKHIECGDSDGESSQVVDSDNECDGSTSGRDISPIEFERILESNRNTSSLQSRDISEYASRYILLPRVHFHDLTLPAVPEPTMFSVEKSILMQKPFIGHGDGGDADVANKPEISIRDDPARLIFCRLRALRHAARCLVNGDPLPRALCYTPNTEDSSPKQARFVMTDNVALGGHRVRVEPSLCCGVLGVFQKGTDVMCHLKFVENKDGRWLQLLRTPLPSTSGFDANPDYFDSATDGAWMLAASSGQGITSPPIVYLTEGFDMEVPWLAVVDFEYALGLHSETDRQQSVQLLLKEEPKMASILQRPPEGTTPWSIDLDFELVQFVSRHKILHASVEDFNPKWLQAYPTLNNFKPSTLVFRLISLHRVIRLLDAVLETTIPIHLVEESHELCDSSFVNDPFSEFDVLRQLYPLSTARDNLIARFLSMTCKSTRHVPPIIQIDRRRARAVRRPATLNDNPQSSGGQSRRSGNGWADSVFHRTFAALQGLSSRLSYRFHSHCGQWWEVNYVGEGIIDQGGGFRDSLAEISDELCPCDSNFLPVTPLFLRSPNNLGRIGRCQAGFIVNPDCRAFAHYSWLGKLMGAALRTDESITLLLPPLFWKTLTGEPVSWDDDYADIDASTVTFLNQLLDIPEDTFDDVFNDLTFTTPISSSRVVEVVPGGNEIPLTWSNRLEYIERVKRLRMEEASAQVAAIVAGIQFAVPRPVLSLLTWQELEIKVCGVPTITVADIQNNCQLDGLEHNSPLVIMLFAVLARFDSAELSQFLRFVTGRRRMPVCIHIAEINEDPSKLPKSATCANTLYLPPYKTEAALEERIRYAIHNCVSIDTDTNPW